MGNINITEERLSIIINNYCSCGGRGPSDDPCQACAIWHEINGEKLSKRNKKDKMSETNTHSKVSNG